MARPALTRLAATARAEGLPLLASLTPGRDVELGAADLETLLAELHVVRERHTDDIALARHIARCARFFDAALTDGRTVTLSWSGLDEVGGRTGRPHLPMLSAEAQLIALWGAALLAATAVLLAAASVSGPVQAYLDLLLA